MCAVLTTLLVPGSLCANDTTATAETVTVSQQSTPVQLKKRFLFMLSHDSDTPEMIEARRLQEERTRQAYAQREQDRQRSEVRAVSDAVGYVGSYGTPRFQDAQQAMNLKPLLNDLLKNMPQDTLPATEFERYEAALNYMRSRPFTVRNPQPSTTDLSFEFIPSQYNQQMRVRFNPIKAEKAAKLKCKLNPFTACFSKVAYQIVIWDSNYATAFQTNENGIILNISLNDGTYAEFLNSKKIKIGLRASVRRGEWQFLENFTVDWIQQLDNARVSN